MVSVGRQGWRGDRILNCSSTDAVLFGSLAAFYPSPGGVASISDGTRWVLTRPALAAPRAPRLGVQYYAAASRRRRPG
jgi:hypothetical protein